MEFSVQTSKKQEIIGITDEVSAIIRKSSIKNGLCNVFVRHATAALIINENADPNICIDFLNALNKAIPDHAGYLHDMVDNNAGAHMKAALIGPSETIPVKEGKLLLGRAEDRIKK